MKQFVLLIILICLVIDDKNLIIAKPENVTNCKNNSKALIHELEYILKVGVKLKQPMNRIYNVNGSVYETDKKELLFVKESSKKEGEKMFHGEFVSLNAIRHSESLLVPRPKVYGQLKNKNNFFALEYLNITSFDNKSSAELGRKLADMHLENIDGHLPTTDKFGFHVKTYYGSIPQNNTWNKDWVTFFVENRLVPQLKMTNTTYFNKTIPVVISFYWETLKPMIPSFFEGLIIKPSLLHGNLRNENVGLLGSKPVIFNPVSFFGHHEYDMATITYKSNFSNEFFEAYHKKIPKSSGFYKRVKLYYLFHLLNEWNQGLSDGFELMDTIDELTDVYYATTAK